MKLTVKKEDTLREFLLENFNGISKTKVKQLLAKGVVIVNGRPCTAYNYTLKPNDTVELATKGSTKNISNQNPSYGSQLKIVYEDDFIIVANKKEGLLSVSTNTNQKEEITAHSLLNDYIKSNPHYLKNNKYATQPRVYIVHRLDKQTSGLMLFAKDEHTKQMLQHNWNDIITDRKYVAVCNGSIPQKINTKFETIIVENNTIKSWLRENSALVVYSSAKDNGGQQSITHYKILDKGIKRTLVELSLDTGRKNQIRVHLQELGYPIYGDKKYYGTNTQTLLENKQAPRLYLHAYTLSFKHPINGKQMNFCTPIPKSFKIAVEGK